MTQTAAKPTRHSSRHARPLLSRDADRPPVVIAEIGVNHDGSSQRAMQLVDAAHNSGADAIKLQLFKTDLLMSSASKLAAYQTHAGETDPFSMLRRLELSIEQMEPLVARAHELGMHAIVTVFSVELVQEAEKLPWDAYKSASPDIINRPLLEAMARTGNPLILSTGASTMDEVVRAVQWVKLLCKDQLGALHCVSSYPTAPANTTLRAVEALARALPDIVIGYSDHTRELDTGCIAATVGARILEKHLTYDRNAQGPDHFASLEPNQFAQYVTNASEFLTAAAQESCQSKNTQLRLGKPVKTVLDCEMDVRMVSRQSLVTTRDLAVNHVITHNDLTIKRPGTGIEPWRMDDIVGSRTTREVLADVPLTDNDLS